MPLRYSNVNRDYAIGEEFWTPSLSKWVSQHDRRVNYIYKLVFKPYRSVWEWGDLEEGKERTRQRIDQEIDSMMCGVRGWRKQDASIVREKLHKKHLKFWEDAESKRKVKDKIKDEIEIEFEEDIEKMRKDFEDKIAKMRKDFEEEVFKLRKDFGIKRFFSQQSSETTTDWLSKFQ